MNEKASKPFDVKHLMISTVVLTAISTGVFLSNETTTHAASIDTNTTTAVTAATNNTTEEDSTTSADAQNSESTVDQTTPETQATGAITEEATSTTEEATSTTEEATGAITEEATSATEAVQPAAEETTTQTAVTSDNNAAENITDNNTENVTDSATAETSSVVAPTTQADPTEETAVDSTLETPSNASTQTTDEAEADGASTETSEATSDETAEATTQTAPMSYQEISAAATADAVDKAAVGNAIDYMIAERPELNEALVNKAKAAVSNVLEDAAKNSQTQNSTEPLTLTYTAKLNNLTDAKNDDDLDIYSIIPTIAVKEKTNSDDLVMDDELVQKAKDAVWDVLEDEFNLYYLSDVDLNNNPGELYASDIVEFAVEAQLNPEDNSAATAATSTKTAEETKQTVSMSSRLVSGDPLSDIVPDASDEQAKQQAAESKAAMRAATEAAQQFSNATSEYPAETEANTTADTQATTTDQKSEDTTEPTADAGQSQISDTATADADATTSDISYYDEASFEPISGDITVVTPGAKDGYPAQIIAANGKEYVYDYQSGDNSVYLNVDNAHIPNVDNISKLVEQELGAQGIKVNTDLNQVSQADLENARTADSITDGDTDYRKQVLAQDGLTSQGNQSVLIPIHLEAVASDEDVAKRILKNIAGNATDYGLAIGQLKNGTYVSYMEYARKDETSEESNSDLYTVEYKSNDGVELHSSTQESADDLAPLPISSYTYDYWTVDDENKTATMYYRLTDGFTDTSNSTELSDTFYEAVNLFRENNGLKVITADPTLATDAQQKADEAAGNLTVGDTEKQVMITSSDPVHTTTTVSGAFIPSEYDEGEGLEDIIDDGLLKISGGNGSEELIDLYNAATTDVGIGITKGSDGKLYYTVEYNMDNDISFANTGASAPSETTDTKSDDPTDSTGTDTSVATTTEPTDTADTTTTTKPAESIDDSTAAKPTDSSDTKAADSTESVTTQANEDSAAAVTDSTVTTAASTTAVKFVNTPAASVKATDLQVTTPVSTQAISETQVSPAIETKEEASSVEVTDSTSDVQNATVKKASVLPQTNEKTGFIGQLMGLVILGITFGISFVRKSRKSTNE